MGASHQVEQQPSSSHPSETGRQGEASLRETAHPQVPDAEGWDHQDSQLPEFRAEIAHGAAFLMLNTHLFQLFTEQRGDLGKFKIPSASELG